MKADPSVLKLKPFKTFTKTFRDFADPRFKCSCGFEFNDEGPCPMDADPGNKETDESKKVKHDVTENPPNAEFTAKFKVLRQMQIVGLEGAASQNYIKYVKGWGVPGKPGYKSPTQMAPVDGQPVLLTEEMCQVCTLLVHAQLPGTTDDKYEFEDWARWSMSDSICTQMVEAIAEAQGLGDFSSPLEVPTKV